MALGPDGQVRRSCSGRLRVPGKSEPNHVELFASLREQYGEKAIVAIQPFGMGRFELLFASERELNIAVERGLLFGGARQDIEPVDSEVKWLYIKYAPFELVEKDLETCLAPYGELKSMEFVYPVEMRPWHNGERKIKFVMKRAVPNFLKVGAYTIHVHYAGVVKLCRKCHSNGHMARECNNNNCRKCGKPGHVEVDCGRGSEDSESPLAIMKMAEKARDDLLKNLRATREDLAKRPLTLRNPEDEDEEEEAETDDTQDNEGDNKEHETEEKSESMPELEDAEESEKEEDPETDEESTGDEQDLEKKKDLKDKGENKKEDSRGIETQRSNKKKMSKQERKKKRLMEEKERNKKRERQQEESDSQEERKSKDKTSYIQQGSEKKNLEKMWMFFKEKRTLGEIKELISNKFEMGIIERIDEQPSGVWGVRLKERRWADQLYQTGFGEGEDTIYPMWWAEEADDGNLKKIYKRVSDSLPDGQNS